MRTLHIGLRVTDLERALAFYTSLGYEVVGTVPQTEFGSLTMLKLPGDEFVALELVHDPSGGPVEPGGLNHLVIRVDDVHTMVAHLAERGISAEEPGSPDDSADFWTAWVSDPDGYRIEIVQWPVGHPDGMTRADFEDPGAEPMTGSHPRSARDVVEEMLRRQGEADETVLMRILRLPDAEVADLKTRPTGWGDRRDNDTAEEDLHAATRVDAGADEPVKQGGPSI